MHFDVRLRQCPEFAPKMCVRGAKSLPLTFSPADANFFPLLQHSQLLHLLLDLLDHVAGVSESLDSIELWRGLRKLLNPFLLLAGDNEKTLKGTFGKLPLPE